jgi:hypothetical protein
MFSSTQLQKLRILLLPLLQPSEQIPFGFFQIPAIVGERVRDRMRSVSHRVMEIARTSRSRVKNQGKEKLQHAYRRLLNSTGQVVAQAKRIANEIADRIKRSRKRADQFRLRALQAELQRMIPLVQQVMRQPKHGFSTMIFMPRTRS